MNFPGHSAGDDPVYGVPSPRRSLGTQKTWKALVEDEAVAVAVSSFEAEVEPEFEAEVKLEGNRGSKTCPGGEVGV